MFDGFKLTIVDQPTRKRLLNNGLLSFDETFNIDTAEVKYQTAKYKSLIIKIYPSGRVELKGSFHKYYNNGAHNYDDFTISKMDDVLKRLQSELDIDPYIAAINNLEFAVNINTLFPPDSLLNDLLCFKWTPFNSMAVQGLGNGKECKSFSQYSVKIYNKGLQYTRPENILRFEKRVNAMVSLKFGKLNLSDLLSPDLWEHCKMELINMVSDILINEQVNINSLSKSEQRIYNAVVNQSNWAKLSRDKKKRYKKSFNNIISRYGQENYRPVIVELITQKCDQLINS